ncbi:MAG: tRNA dihydrouridine synthase DusB [Clostridia bacterium]|nr:tRNA dihydrouridine synthase DusB [Clostridia bacterium]
MSVTIGNVTLTEGAVLAPMAGVTDAPFRLLCREQGAALTVTEMVSAKGALCAPPGNRALRDLLYALPGSGPTALQLFGSEPAVMAEAALRLLGGAHAFCLIDLNMGCPAPKIVREGAGSALMREPLQAARIVEAVARAAPVPVTVKMRLGWEAAHRNGLAFARAMQESGAAAVTVHGRARDQFFAGEADWEAVAEIKAALRIPVLGNGDIATGAQAAERAARAACDGVMIGRGAMGNPWVFADALRALRGQPPLQVGWEERAAAAARHLRMMVDWKGERAAVPEMRKHIGWYVKGWPGAAKLRAAVNRMETMRQMLDALDKKYFLR